MPHRSVQDDGLIRFLSRIPAFRDKIVPPSTGDMLLGLAGGVGIAVVATLLRFWIDPWLPPGFPYLTFFPAVIVAGFVLGMIPALLTAVLCGLAAWYWFIAPVNSFALGYQSGVALAFYFVVVVIDLGLLQLALAAYRSQARAKAALQRMLEMEETISGEVDHRMKNMLATVSGLISLSKRHADTPEELATKLQGRLAAMGEAVRLLRTSLGGRAGDMSSTLKSGLMPLGLTEGERLTLEGPLLALDSSAIVALNLIVHELGTNAIKYGALSAERGRVLVQWREVQPAEPDADGTIEIIWTERDGPAPTAPTRQGFGTDLVTRMAASLGGNAGYEFGPDGAVFRLSMARSQLS